MNELRPDFEARMTRVRTTPFAVGYRPSFHYPGDDESDYMILPVEWFTVDGAQIPPDGEVPIEFVVKMGILNPDLRDLHRQRLRVGTQFQWRDGYQVTAFGEVTRILDLAL